MNIKTNRKLKKIFKFIYYEVVVIFALVFILILLSLLGIPEQARILVVESGSMEPTILTGSLIVDTIKSDYKVGDVITFNTISENLKPTTNVTHRIIGEEYINGEKIFRTKGDANNTVDAFSVKISNILGKVTLSIPYLGYVIGWGKTKVGFVILIIIPTIILIISELLEVRKETVKLLNKRKLLKNEKI